MGSRVDAEGSQVVESAGAKVMPDAPGVPMPAEGNARYGIDSPTMIAAFAAIAAGFAFWGTLVAVGQGVGAAIGPWVAALLCVGAAAYMVRSSRVVKAALWRGHLDDLELRGKERALDVGCGSGLVTIELAKRLPRGNVVGIDIWRTKDHTGNSRSTTEANVGAEGVADRVEIIDASMEELPFADAEFDVVTASLSLHCLALARGRGDAMKEIMRVTKPGGRVVILDVGKTFEYQAWLNDAGWSNVVRGRGSYSHYPPVRTVTGRKPR